MKDKDPANDRFSSPMNLYVGEDQIFSESKTSLKLEDGLIVLQNHLNLYEIMRTIENTAVWVAPETFKLLPIWYPEYSRGAQFYKKNWSERLTNTNQQSGITIDKLESNRYANKALTQALGLRSIDRTNWSCCHIWSPDDPKFQKGNRVIKDRRYYSCVANMVLLPTPLKAFTDAIPEVKAMLRICARNLYGWHCDHEQVADEVEIIDGWQNWDAYPESWPTTLGEKRPIGIRPLSIRIQTSATNRLNQIRHDLENSGESYPKSEVKIALDYWNIAI
jgi:hypothetical protein